jgi:hypothetical protein
LRWQDVKFLSCNKKNKPVKKGKSWNFDYWYDFRCLIPFLTDGKRNTGQVDKHWHALDKYQLALFLNKKRPFDKGSSIWEGVYTLFKLRNYLTHYKPEWHVIGGPESVQEGPQKDDTRELNEKLMTYRFKLNPFASGFPLEYMGFGGTTWAVRLSLAFTDTFCKRMCMKPRYSNDRQYLTI